ncbi:MAG: hypothetical protein AB1405_01090 [Bdellovibrionota bacterium]
MAAETKAAPKKKPAPAKAETKEKAKPAADATGATIGRDTAGRKVLKFNALEIEGEHDTPNVIIIQEWTPPKDAVIEDQATDDLDRVFTGIRALNRPFDRELADAPDSEAILKESEVREEERRLLESDKQNKQAQRVRKTSLR